jgi:hypothetical protein
MLLELVLCIMLLCLRQPENASVNGLAAPAIWRMSRVNLAGNTAGQSSERQQLVVHREHSDDDIQAQTKNAESSMTGKHFFIKS